MVLCMASTNTNVNEKEIASAFSAARGLVPPECENTLLGSANNAYTTSLFELGNCLDKMKSEATPEQKESDRGRCADTAGDAAHTVSKLVAEHAGADQVDKAVEALLSRPIEDRTLQSQLKAPSSARRARPLHCTQPARPELSQRRLAGRISEGVCTRWPARPAPAGTNESKSSVRFVLQ